MGQFDGSAVHPSLFELRDWYVLDRQNMATPTNVYFPGWITVVGWVAGFAAGAFFVSSLIQALMVLNNPDYDPTGWQGTLIFWAVILVCALINTVLGKVLPAIEIGILILHTVGFFAIIVPLLYLAPKTTGQEVFTTFQNLGGWSSIVLSFFVGLNGNAVAFVGKSSTKSG